LIQFHLFSTQFSLDIPWDKSNQEVQRPVDTEHVNLVFEALISFALLDQLLAVSEKLLAIHLTVGSFVVKADDQVFLAPCELLLLQNNRFQIGFAGKFVLEELIVLLDHDLEIFVHAGESFVIRHFHDISQILFDMQLVL
jgi:hypothetical protein